MSRVRKPSILELLARVIAITIVATLTMFAVALLLGIIGIVLAHLIRGGSLHMASAYRQVALPVAGATLVVAFAAALTVEIRQYRRTRSA
jgi:hypothetical protein